MFAWLTQSKLLGAFGALLLISNVSWYIAYDLKDDAYKAEKIAHQQTKDNYEKAQLEAELIATKKAREDEQRYAKEAAKADTAYSALLSKYNASLLRYKASQSTASTIDLSGTTTTTDGTYSTSDSTRILITISDAQICAVNTARLQAAHEWAKTLENK